MNQKSKELLSDVFEAGQWWLLYHILSNLLNCWAKINQLNLMHWQHISIFSLRTASTNSKQTPPNFECKTSNCVFSRSNESKHFWHTSPVIPRQSAKLFRYTFVSNTFWLTWHIWLTFAPFGKFSGTQSFTKQSTNRKI